MQNVFSTEVTLPIWMVELFLIFSFAVIIFIIVDEVCDTLRNRREAKWRDQTSTTYTDAQYGKKTPGRKRGSL